jgi:hypothetical protein
VPITASGLSVPSCRSAVANYVPFEKIGADFSPRTLVENRL